MNHDALTAALGADAVAALHGYRLEVIAEAGRRGLRMGSDTPPDVARSHPDLDLSVDPLDICLTFLHNPGRADLAGRTLRWDPADGWSLARTAADPPACFYAGPHPAPLHLVPTPAAVIQWATGPLDPAGHGDPPAGAELDDDPEAIHRLLSFINPYHQMFLRETAGPTGPGTQQPTRRRALDPSRWTMASSPPGTARRAEPARPAPATGPRDPLDGTPAGLPQVQPDRGTGGRPAGGAGADRGGLVHPALFYASNQEYRAGLLPFVTDGLAAAEPVLVAVPGERIELLRTGLGRAADQVRFIDMTDAGRNPGRIIPRLLGAFIDEHPAQPTRVIGEPIWAGRSTAEYPACVQHEALINVALADRPVTIVCPYDTARLDPAVLADAECTHPLLIEHGQWRPNPDFADPATVVQSWNQPLPEPAEVPTTLVFTAPDGPRQVRRATHEVAQREGLTGRRLTDLLLAVNEIAVNTLLHTGRPGIFSIWRDRGEIVCQVHDSGHLADPLAGRHHPAPYDLAEAGGHGLRLVHDVCDLVRIHTHPDATTIRLHMRIPRT